MIQPIDILNSSAKIETQSYLKKWCAITPDHGKHELGYVMQLSVHLFYVLLQSATHR